MKRRDFLKQNVTFATLGLMAGPFLYAHNHEGGMQDHHGANHGNHMNHMMHSTHDMSQNTHRDTSFITLHDKHIKLLDSTLLPQNAKLQPLILLTNQSNKKGFFKASIEINEMHTTFAAGKPTRCYVYSDASKKNKSSFVAPKIEVFEGDEVEINVQNNLKETTTIHWHGLPVPPDQDGSPHDPILAGESRVYRFKLPKDCAGTYWYHPHPHFLTSKQVSMGLAGAFVVKSHKDSLSHLQEQDWFITDLRLDSEAQIPANGLGDWLDGREGEIVLINGQYKPKIMTDSLQRIRIYNCCSARYLHLHIDGARFILVGTDGGLLEKPVQQESLLLCPASRVEVILDCKKSGQYKLTSHYYDRDKMMPKQEPKVLSLADLDYKSISDGKIPTTLRVIKSLGEARKTYTIMMSEDHRHMHGLSKKNKEEIKQSLASMFLINGKTFDMQRVDLETQVGMVHDLLVANRSHMDHPFHIHGTQFEIIESTQRNKTQKPPFKSLRDTINVRPGETLRLRMKQDFVGMRMFHCHILEHEDLGMMGILDVRTTRTTSDKNSLKKS